MAQPALYPWKTVLADITVTALTAGATHTSVITGTSSSSDTTGTSQITKTGTQNSITSTALSGQFGDATDIIVIPAIAADGTFPDAQVWPYVDGTDLGDKILLDGSAPGNMMPSPSVTVGQRHISLGIPYRQAVAAGMRNLPLKATGLKYVRQLQFRISSTSGWTTTDQPMRLIVLGDKLDATALQNVAAQGYAGGFQNSVPAFPSINLNHQLPGGMLTAATWTALSGGNSQAATKVFRFFRNAYNAVATPASGLFILSNYNAVQGAQGNVATDNQDLGFDYTDGTRYLAVTEYGIRAGTNTALAFVKVNDTVLPDSQGVIVTPGVNFWQYGNVQNQRSGSGLYYAMSKTPFPVVAYQNKVAFGIVANGSTVAANATSVAVGGVLVETGNAA